MKLLRDGGRPLVIGHRGAAAVAAENTLASLEAAVTAGADIVEFDVQPGLVLAHSTRSVAADPVSLDDALAFLASREIGVHLDLKLPGYEAEALAALRQHGLVDRSLVSTTFAATTRAFARLAPELPRAIGYPRDRYGVSRVRWPPFVGRTGAAALRQVMPVRVQLLVRVSRATVLALHHALCSRATIAAAHSLRVPVLAWPVNDEGTVRRLTEIGVDAIVSDDPRMVLATLTGR